MISPSYLLTWQILMRLLGMKTKAVLFLNSLPEEYEHFVTTITYGKDALKYANVTAAVVNHEYY